MNIGRLITSSGWIDFDAETGSVTGFDLDADFGAPPLRVNVDEWRRRYPKEHSILANEHDILDFGLWFPDGYDPPCEEWRVERELLRRDEL